MVGIKTREEDFYWCYCPMAAGYRHRPTAACPRSATYPKPHELITQAEQEDA